ncbi:ankyrin repeat-containing domain protein, partial [Limtongia smithiae]|uniref:ankyrin repeat-containing domain protein n=1 Tax=Limtongia smithiae TaxID=1125753 RepID=UPI0034CE2B53
MQRPLTEEEADDVVYFARSGDLEEFSAFLTSLATELSVPSSTIVQEAKDPYSGSTALHMACANGHVEIVNYLLSLVDSFTPAAIAFVNMQNESGNTALHWACLNGLQEIVTRLCDAGADPFIKNSAGQDSIFQAENNEKLDVVDYMLERYSDAFEGELIDESGE